MNSYLKIMEVILINISYLLCIFGLYITISIFSNLNVIDTEEYLTWKYNKCRQNNSVYFSGVHYKRGE